MAKNSIDAYGANGKSNVLFFDPESLHLVTDTSHPLYDERVHLPLSESVILNIMELGVIEPIIVWKDPESGKTCVVAGRQRVKNATEANARRKRAVLGDTKPRLKSRKEITQTLQNATGDYAAALRWVLGDDKAPD